MELTKKRNSEGRLSVRVLFICPTIVRPFISERNKKFGHGVGTDTEMFFIRQANHSGGGILDLIPCPLLFEGEGGLWITITSLRSAGEKSKQDIFVEKPGSIPCQFFFRVQKNSERFHFGDLYQNF